MPEGEARGVPVRCLRAESWPPSLKALRRGDPQILARINVCSRRDSPRARLASFACGNHRVRDDVAFARSCVCARRYLRFALVERAFIGAADSRFEGFVDCAVFVFVEPAAFAADRLVASFGIRVGARAAFAREDRA